MDDRDGNIAFKCTYNDGGKSGFVGFDGTCSDGNILRNVVLKPRTWCSDKENYCRNFCDGGFQGRRPLKPCYESELFQKWRFGPGFYHSGENAGKPISMKHAREGKIALFTTRHPDHDHEDKRIVFGVSRIQDVHMDDDGATWIHGDHSMCIRLASTTALSLPFWGFKSLPKGNKPKWGSGLFRCISDDEVTYFLNALYPYLQSAEDRFTVEQLALCCGAHEIPNRLEKTNVTPSAGDIEKMYGPGGEGNAIVA